MASINDVAKLAGVSTSTVSKVLNNYRNISEETRDKVLHAAAELNYVPNAIASALSSKNEKRVGVVIFINLERQAIDEINMQYLFGSFHQAQQLGLEVVTVFSSVFEKMNKDEIVQYFKSQRIQTIIVYGLKKKKKRFKEIIDKQIFKMILIDVPISGEKTSYLMVNHRQAQYDIAKAMILENKTPVKKLLYLAGRHDGYVTDLRLQGVKEVCNELNVELTYHYGEFSEKLAKEIVMEHGQQTDVVVCASDLMAIGAVSALDDLQVFKPVCGYDGIKLLGYVDYRIKTVHQNFFKIAESAMCEAKRLIDREKGRSLILDYQIGTVKYEDVIL